MGKKTALSLVFILIFSLCSSDSTERIDESSDFSEIENLSEIVVKDYISEQKNIEISIPEATLDPDSVLQIIFDQYINFSIDPKLSIEQIWIFAHPSNREETGPKDRFAKLITQEPYDSLIDIKSYEYEVVNWDKSLNSIMYELEIVKEDSTKTKVLWILKQGKCPLLEDLNCWLTQSVFMNQSVLTNKSKGQGV